MVQIENLSFGYSKKKLLFDQLNLELPAGSIYGLLGKNGAGKSTLLKIIAGLQFPSQGHIAVEGLVPKVRLPQFLREIYFVGEEFELPAMDMSDFVKLFGAFYPRFSNELFDKYITEFELDRKLKLTKMSYGQKKKFSLAFGLATDCRLLILDEPTNGLDIPSKSQFRKVVANAIHEERSFIISTHQVRDMENLIDPIIILNEGKIVFFEDYETVAKKLAFTKQVIAPDPSTLVYSESTLGGFTVIKENIYKEETNMNLETLFKAVVSNTTKINEIFKR